ncbi:RluA family pseudouridine synthase [Sediminitomix flava]|uniref:tRNA pseudouridine32 synthase / 23S rRNA pseudouridine746 synthase n=1 Tax=Sediminitomix flava TaxID=379075 RepID=A0A315ZAV8_SEDFL|nr:RluA family pseudouridine synthase [Sediminitomix flava]PWJ42726.1 tRNA pseudouridine32 synthase / 23S rRNA pseudouridine746 synthase [Sediminitomix flava]
MRSEQEIAQMQNCFRTFEGKIDDIELPKKFTFPFYYEPHPLCIQAAKELQHHISTQTDWTHNFGLNKDQEGMVIGKMFGVLVVRNSQNQLGYLAAFSGKLADQNHHKGFVPPVFDMLSKNSFFLEEQEQVNALNDKIENLENALELKEALLFFESEKSYAQSALEEQKQVMKAEKQARNQRRKEGKENLSEEDFSDLEKELQQESIKGKIVLKHLNLHWKERVEKAENSYNEFIQEINQLKKERKQRSAKLQRKLFDQYQFLNKDKQRKGLFEIFENTTNGVPPAAAGECAAPKLFQYAFENDLVPVAMAEFWWGASPKSEIRKHGQFYPSCRGKCEPILGHMLEGIEMDENPMLTNPATNKELPIVFEDDYLLVVNKPHDFLSVPGKTILDSVYARMREKFPNASGPLIVHRLDMATSGLMLIAKSEEIYKDLQSQFINRTVKKRYIALLDGEIEGNSGEVKLPIRVDLDDRPRQLVCYEYGKHAHTEWEKIEMKDGKTRVHFYPITGRTHQLRVHSAHSLGLNSPIVGDDLYGTKASRLHLHAEKIDFTHPISKERLSIQVDPNF